MVRRLGLGECADTLVGGESSGHVVPGVSGGERRRLAIGAETVGGGTAGIRALFADEPTTGLDSFHADKVIDVLVQLAHDHGCAAIASIHQPRSASFLKAQDLLLMAPGGHVAYIGETQGVLSHFKALGFECPSLMNPAEYLIDLCSIDTSSRKAEAASKKRIRTIVTAWATEWPRRRAALFGAPSPVDGQLPVVAAAAAEPALVQPLGPLQIFGLLLRRALLQAKRDLYVNSTRALCSVVLGGAFGSLNRRLGLGQKSVARRAALLMQAVINTGFLAMVKSLNGFPKERAVVRREMERGTGPGCGGYSSTPYFVAKLLVDAPIDAFFPVVFGAIAGRLAGLQRCREPLLLGALAMEGVAASALGLSISALAPSTEAALALGPCVMVLSIMLGDSGGMFAEIPAGLQPLARLSLIKWGFDGAMSAEMPGLRFKSDDSMLPAGLKNGSRAQRSAVRRMAAATTVRTGEEVLERLRVGQGGCRRAAAAQCGVIAVNLGATFLALQAMSSSPHGLRPDPRILPPPDNFEDWRGKGDSDDDELVLHTSSSGGAGVS